MKGDETTRPRDGRRRVYHGDAGMSDAFSNELRFASTAMRLGHRELVQNYDTEATANSSPRFLSVCVYWPKLNLGVRFWSA